MYSYGSSDCHWRAPFMMLFVNPFVQVLLMNESVTVVETDFIDQNANCQVINHSRKVRNISQRIFESSRLFNHITQISHWHINEYLIHQHNANCFHQKIFIERLILYFVFLQKFWLFCQIEKHVNAAEEPVSEKCRVNCCAEKVHIEIVVTENSNDSMP